MVKPPRALRGEDKLRAALDGFAIDVTDRECVDLGASAGSASPKIATTTFSECSSRSIPSLSNAVFASR